MQKVNNIAPKTTPGINYLLAVAYKAITPIPKTEPDKCRFGMFIRLRPGMISYFPNQVRVWYYPGDRFTKHEPKMLKNLINLVKNRIAEYDRVIIYDHTKTGEENEIVKIVDDEIKRNYLHLYSLMLGSYPLPEFLKIRV